MATLDDMITNKIPVQEIVNCYKSSLDVSHYHRISKYCSQAEYYKYCHKFGDLVRLENPNMTVKWYVDVIGCSNMDWYSCAIVRSDLFTPEVIMKYYKSISKDDNIWSYYYKRFPIDFITRTVENMYCDNFRNCIDVLRQHPSGVSWEFIDRYLTIHPEMFNFRKYSLYIPVNVHDLPLWFVKKYIMSIYLRASHLNEWVTYKFVLKHLDEFGNRIPETEFAKMTAKHNFQINMALKSCYDIDADLLSVIERFF